MLKEYFEKLQGMLDEMQVKEKDGIMMAAQQVAGSIQRGGIIHMFGCGHSHLLTEEVFYRSGGLVPIRPIFHEPLMLHEGAATSSEIERMNDYAKGFMEMEDIRSEDVVFVLSTSGRNPVPVDVAQISRGTGAYVIGMTSLAYSQSQPSRHVSGKHLSDSVDLVIDNGAPVGDTLLRHDKVDVPFAPSSTIIGAAILNAIFAESIGMMANEGFEPPVFKSGNVDGSDDHNRRLIEKYKDRIPLLR